MDWLALDSAAYAFAIGDWERDRRLPRRPRPPPLRHDAAAQAPARARSWRSGAATTSSARDELAATERLARDSTEPQFLGPLGALRGELARREGDLVAARAAVDEALDRIEFCSDDITQVSGVSAVGIRIEADAAQRARDRDDADAEREARLRCELLLARIEAGAEMERAPLVAELTTARAEEARARGEDDLGLWELAAEAWEQLERPYAVAYARWREAEAAALAGERERATARGARSLRDHAAARRGVAARRGRGAGGTRAADARRRDRPPDAADDTAADGARTPPTTTPSG